jgi:16S rRNA (cytosine1402-N4)-methyltransferase
MTIHKPVLLKESIEGLNLKNGDMVVDATLGGGGHGLEMLKKILPDGKLIAIDQDQKAINDFRDKLESLRLKPKKENIVLVHDNFRNIREVVFSKDVNKVNAIIADLGISSDQLENKERGFSFQQDVLLDMRMDGEKGITAGEIINKYKEEELLKIFREYGDERYAMRIAREIAKQRKIKPLKTTKELVSIISSAVPENYKHGKIHFATRVFQALRIETNEELESIREFIPKAINILDKGGRLAIISFHSGEDKIVKEIFRENVRGCICPPGFPVCRCGRKPAVKLVNRKPISPREEEMRSNPRSRSAKLRIIEKI